MKKLKYIVMMLLFLGFFPASAAENEMQQERIAIGSKTFTESRLLGEIMAQLLEQHGFSVERRLGLGGTLICFGALKNNEIQLYAEYSGTLEQVMLKSDRRLTVDEVRSHVREVFGLEFRDPFGFNNTYALAARRDFAAREDFKRVSDLLGRNDIKFGFSLEFLNRPDGWPGLVETYGFEQTPSGIKHGLAYQAIHQEEIDIIDAYSTDGKLAKFDLVILEDDRHFFPSYLAAPLVRPEVPLKAKRLLDLLGGLLPDERMQKLNAAVEVEGKSFAEVAHQFLQEEGLIGKEARFLKPSLWTYLGGLTLEHLALTFSSLLAAMLVAIPLGVVVYRVRAIARPILTVVGIFQTIPSIALLAFMIPFFGIGVRPAIVALFLYALLPILRNTAAALFSIDPVLKKVSVGMGLTLWQRLRYIEIPLAAPTIMAGIRTAAVINIGTATLAAFIGAGGLGEPIVTGLDLNDTTLIMQGAIPAALLAIAVEQLLELAEKALVPKHLLQKPAQ